MLISPFSLSKFSHINFLLNINTFYKYLLTIIVIILIMARKSYSQRMKSLFRAQLKRRAIREAHEQRECRYICLSMVWRGFLKDLKVP